MEPSGSRGWESIDYPQTCLISGLDVTKNYHILFDNSKAPCIVLNGRLADYCLEYLNFKIGYVGQPEDIAIKWSEDEWRYNSGKVFRRSILEDYQTTTNILDRFDSTLKRVDEQNSSK